MRIAFDCDGTLIDYTGKPRTKVIALFKALQALGGCNLIVWSGGGRDYAKNVALRLNLPGPFLVASKTEAGKLKVDLAIDDLDDCALGVVNLITKPSFEENDNPENKDNGNVD